MTFSPQHGPWHHTPRFIQIHPWPEIRPGLNMNFAPYSTNTNPNNPVIGLRSFGDDPIIVATLGEQYIEGLQNAGIIAIAKHFPGHGDVDVDSHMELPIITVPRTALETRELLPFRSHPQHSHNNIFVLPGKHPTSLIRDIVSLQRYYVPYPQTLPPPGRKRR